MWQVKSQQVCMAALLNRHYCSFTNRSSKRVDSKARLSSLLYSISSNNKKMTTATTKTTYAFPPRPIPSIPIVAAAAAASNDAATSTTTCTHFPVHRIYCVGQNYAEHALEMGSNPDREPPFFFTKPADAIVPVQSSSSSSSCSNNEPLVCCQIPYPLATKNFHYECELVIAIGKEGVEIPVQEALSHVFGYAVGIDLTRRDLQTLAKQQRRPWDCSKGFDQSAPISPIHPITVVNGTEQQEHELLLKKNANIWLSVNGEMKQSAQIDAMIWSIPEIISILSNQFHLVPGDLIFTGTPAGVGPLVVGDVITAGVQGIDEITLKIV